MYSIFENRDFILYYDYCYLAFTFVVYGYFRMHYVSSKKKIPELYMNEQGVNIRGSFISWNWIIEMEIKTVSYGPTVKDSEMIFIYYHKPEETGEHTISIMPDEDEIEEIRRYIEAFWQYYKTE
nr:MAG TPA: protein of unknown function (DUF5381) [Caudoviricetes sp.]